MGVVLVMHVSTRYLGFKPLSDQNNYIPNILRLKRLSAEGLHISASSIYMLTLSMKNVSTMEAISTISPEINVA